MKFVDHAMIRYLSWGWYVDHAMIGYWSCGWYVDRTDDRGVDHAWCITKLCHYESYRDHYNFPNIEGKFLNFTKFSNENS